MKTIIKILLLGVFLVLASCQKEVIGGRLRTLYLVDIRFVDEAGNSLLDRVKLEGSHERYTLDRSQYTLKTWLNEQALGVEPEAVPAVSDGSIVLPCTAGQAEPPSNGDAILVYKLEFTCPGLFGDDLVHTIVIEKKAKNEGFVNNFERLLFDGKVISTNMEGDSSDYDRLPVVIVVPQK